MEKSDQSESATLRQKAEELLSKGLQNSIEQFSEAEMYKLLHELQVHQLELELLNGELIQAKEQAVIASEKYIELYDFAPSGYYTLSRTGEILNLNLMGAEMLGKDRSQIKNRLFQVFLSDNSKPLFRQFLNKIFSSNTKESCELNLPKKDDLPMYIHLSGIVAENGDQCYITATDITKRKKAESELLASNEFNQTLLNTIPFGMNIVDENGNILYLSEGLQQHFGAGTLGKKCWELYRDNKKQCSDCPLHAGINIGLTETYESHGVLGGKIFEVSHTGMIFNGQKAMLEIFIDVTERKKAEVALLKSESEFRMLAESMPQIVWITRPEGSNIYFNQHWVDYTGLTMEESYGAGWNKPFHPDDQQRAWDAWQNATSNLANYSLECRLRRFDGEYKWWLIRGVPVLDEHGAVVKWFGTCTDINEMKLAEIELYEREIQYQNLANSGPALIWTSGIDKLCNYFNEGWMAFTGRTLEQELGNGWAEGVHPDDLDQCIATYFAAFDRHEPFEMEYRLRHASGEYRWMIDLGTPNFKSTGEFIGYIGNCFDITERKQTEESLLMLKTAIEKSEVSVLITDNKGNIEYANPYFTELSGYTASEYIGQSPKILKSDYQTKEYYEELWNTITSGKTWEGEFYNRKKNGEYYWENAIISPIENDKNEITHFVAIKTDITQAKNTQSELIKAKEHAEESDQLKSAFLANMSHEIRTPLNSIIGFSDLLNDPDFDQEQKTGFTKTIIENGNNLMVIINDILDLSMIAAGQIKFKKDFFSIQKLLEDLDNDFKMKASGKGIDLRLSFPSDGQELIIENDNYRIKQILTNFIGNAIKFTSHGFVEFGYLIMGENIEFQVKDTGIGIAREHYEAVFDRFRQVEITKTRRYGGNGLGLAISKNLAELLGGKIWVESEVGKGSTFHLSIPIHSKSNENTVSTHKIETPVKEIQIRNLKILIAEDEDDSSKLISIGVLKYASEIINVQTGKEAVEACRNNPDIDLVLMDIQMPEMDGYEATRQIRQFNKDVIIIAQTAFALSGDKEKTLEAGCNDYISKPIRKDELMQLMQKYFC